MPVKLKTRQQCPSSRDSLGSSRAARRPRLRPRRPAGLRRRLRLLLLQVPEIVDQRLAAGPLFANTAQIYAAPNEVRTGQKLTAASIAQDLRAAGYNANPAARHLPALAATPSSSSPARRATTPPTAPPSPPARRRRLPLVTAITAENGAALGAYELEPQLITALSTGQEPHQAPPRPLQRDPPAHGPGRHRHRGPPLLRARRRQLHAHSPSAPSPTSSPAARAAAAPR